jgi:hypothetical protein
MANNRESKNSPETTDEGEEDALPSTSMGGATDATVPGEEDSRRMPQLSNKKVEHMMIEKERKTTGG